MDDVEVGPVKLNRKIKLTEMEDQDNQDDANLNDTQKNNNYEKNDEPVPDDQAIDADIVENSKKNNDPVSGENADKTNKIENGENNPVTDEHLDETSKTENDEKIDSATGDEHRDDADEVENDDKDNMPVIKKQNDTVNDNNVSGEKPIDSDKTDNVENNGVPDEKAVDDKIINWKLSDVPEVSPPMTKLSLLPSFKLNSAEIKKFKIWPGGIIPYFIDDFSYGKIQRDKIRDYLDEAETMTGLTFQELAKEELPNGDDKRWVFFVNRRGQLDCKDYTTESFTNSGVQKVTIGYDCLNDKGPMAAIVLALAGVPPQHNAPDRDRYIKVSMESVVPGKKDVFKRLGDGDWLFHDIPYDYTSAGHYSSYKYTVDGSATITSVNKARRASKTDIKNQDDQIPSDPSEDETFISLGGNSLSNIDIQKIRMLYNNVVQTSPLKQIKSEECKALYRPGRNFGLVKLIGNQKLALEKPKPKKYLDALQGVQLSDLDK